MNILPLRLLRLAQYSDNQRVGRAPSPASDPSVPQPSQGARRGSGCRERLPSGKSRCRQLAVSYARLFVLQHIYRQPDSAWRRISLPAMINTTIVERTSSELWCCQHYRVWRTCCDISSPDSDGLSTVWAITPWTLPGRYSVFAPFAMTDARPAPGPRMGAADDRGDGAIGWG